MIWLGLDISTGSKPGSGTGWGLVEDNGRGLRHLASGVWVAKGKTAAARIQSMTEQVSARDWAAPRLSVAVEAPFVGRSPKTALVLGWARGAILEALGRGHDAVDLSPSEIKQDMTGSGRAGKEVVARMVGVHLGIAASALGTMSDDETDALAVALVAAMRNPARRPIAAELAERERYESVMD